MVNRPTHSPTDRPLKKKRKRRDRTRAAKIDKEKERSGEERREERISIESNPPTTHNRGMEKREDEASPPPISKCSRENGANPLPPPTTHK